MVKQIMWLDQLLTGPCSESFFANKVKNELSICTSIQLGKLHLLRKSVIWLKAPGHVWLTRKIMIQWHEVIKTSETLDDVLKLNEGDNEEVKGEAVILYLSCASLLLSVSEVTDIDLHLMAWTSSSPTHFWKKKPDKHQNKTCHVVYT